MLNFEGLEAELLAAPLITIFRHEHPDCDAVGAAFGLKSWLLSRWPDKKVYVLGFEEPDQGVWPKGDTAADAMIKGSLAVVLDTANQPRIDDSRYALARRIIKIDHHPEVERFGDLQFVFPQCAATCEILADFFEGCGFVLSKETAAFLYKGLLTDTLSYATSNTTAHTLRMGAYLAERGIDIPALNRELFDRDLASFHFASMIRASVQMRGKHLAYVLISQKQLEENGKTPSQARGYVSELMDVRDFAIWALFTEKKGEKGEILYDGSLRSKTLPINDIALRYEGGGHPNACGVKNLSPQRLEDLLGELEARIHDSSGQIVKP